MNIAFHCFYELKLKVKIFFEETKMGFHKCFGYNYKCIPFTVFDVLLRKVVARNYCWVPDP
jgi:hypothetical protein